MQAPTIPDGSPLLRALFVALTFALALAFAGAVVWSGRRAGSRSPGRDGLVAGLVAAVWIAATGIAASAGALRFTAPPTMMVGLVLSMIIAIAISFSPLGRRLALGIPVVALVGYQAFRIGVELLMHRAYTEGLMPVQMSYSGRNFDIITGFTAIVGALWLARHPSRRVLFAWNTLGLLLLLNILVVALLSTPTPMRVFMNEPPNVWIAHAPWVWLPTVMVVAALAGHLLVYRRLWIERAARVL